MAQFWKPGTERPPLLVDDDDGTLLLHSTASRSSSSSYGYVSIEKQRQRLPVFKYRTAILYLVETHATTIIVGETGSGKTTQLPQGDHVTFLNVYKDFFSPVNHQNGVTRILSTIMQWVVIRWTCGKTGDIDLRKVIEIREQLRRISQRIGISLKSCEGNLQVVQKAVTAGFFASACKLEAYSHNGMYKTLRGSQEVHIYSSSVLFRVNPKWVVYHNIVSTDRQYMRNVMSIDRAWLREAAPQFYRQSQNHSSSYL